MIGQVWDGRLQRVEAIVQRQQRMPAECHDDRLVLDRQNRRSWLSGAGRQVGNRATLPPLRHRLRVDAVAPAKDPQALLTMLYRSTDCLCRGGAAVQNLAHSASLHSREKSAPSKPGIKQVGPWHDLYTLIGTASATLIGLLFVAASVGASYYNRERYPAFRAFVSPSVVHFTTVLAACLIGIAPVRSWTPFGLLIGGDGLFGIVYAVFVWRSMVLQGFNRTLDLN